MKTMHLIIIFSVLSLATMILVDYIIGPKAEFLNAFSAAQRLIGQEPTFGYSMVATKFGSVGELIVIIIANLAAGGTLTFITRFFVRS